MVNLTRFLSLEVRKKFSYPDKNLLRWFPGHMGKGMKQIEQKLKSVDCIVEVHDARVPISGRNPKFKYTVTSLKPHILVLNKKDLADLSKKDEIEQRLSNEGINNVIFTNCKDQMCTGLKRLIPEVCSLVQGSNRYNRTEENNYTVMIIGIPNVGKSSLINSLKNKHMSKASSVPVGAVAGITRGVSSHVKISHTPLVYVLDTPGILSPVVNNLETGLKLALCSTMQDHLVGNTIIADYLLYWLNSNQNFSYVDYLGLKEPSDDIAAVLSHSAVTMGKIQKKKNVATGSYITVPDMGYSAQYFIKGFRSGTFGKVMLDV